jgi:hypothetical protein
VLGVIVITVNTRAPLRVAGSDNVTRTGKLAMVPPAQSGSQLLTLCIPVPTAFVMFQLLQRMLPRLSALVAQPMKIRVGSNPDPPSWGSQLGAAGRADDGVVTVVLVPGASVVGVVVVLVGSVVAGGTEVVEVETTFG